MPQQTILLPKELPITTEELEDFLRNEVKAEIIHPLRADPVARKNGKIIAIWLMEW